MADERMKPTLIVNPADDGVFAAFAQVLVDDGALSIEDLEGRLRAVYPHAAVHARELAAEPALIWYVYREGRWVATARPLHDTGGKAALDPADPHVAHLSEQVEQAPRTDEFDSRSTS